MWLQDQHAFELLRDFIWEKSGLYFESTKRQYFWRRVQNRMRLLDCFDGKEYYRILRSDTSETELRELLNVLTTTETYFFRNEPQLRAFQEEILPEMLRRKRAQGDCYLRFWSAGCSSGEEPYTLGMILREHLPQIEQWNITVVGTDINTRMVQKAQEGVYHVRSLRETPDRYRAKYFTVEGDQYRLHDVIKKMVTFRVGNLMHAEDASLMHNVDCIFCRNVLIYFNVESCQKVITMFYETMATQGYLLLGHSESLYRISAIFKLMKLKHSLVYYKE
ncbi:MCP methyltransferase, CheR-type [Candidatus Vecturithrix granuli]|uniref:protein-glutamate O-methyltransferase n=1 Tax=Vecturithrix granuli TaxID=1499967 RepID=A0A081BU12_VECG1|nr:MCP methyltransferase, CheR-type [Candidatus Vecturithrix granuli]